MVFINNYIFCVKKTQKTKFVVINFVLNNYFRIFAAY